MDNPYTSPLAQANSNATNLVDGKLTRLDGRRATKMTGYVHDQFRALIQTADFPCIAAKSAFNTGNYRFALYEELGGKGSSEGLAHDLCQFVQDGMPNRDYVTFVASFLAPRATREQQFERALWRQLQRLNDLDTSAYDPTVRSNPDSPDFAFSFAGQALFVAGLHGGSKMLGRVFAYPTLVFNHHQQFRRIREAGKFERLKEAIHAREIALQGYSNPSSQDHSNMPEGAQYAGVLHPLSPTGAWQCPFHARQRDNESG